jgi:hypothetical protein
MAKLFNSYCVESAEELQCNFSAGTNKHTTVNQKLFQSIFFTSTNDDEINAVIKGLKNKTSSRLDGFSSSLTKKCHTSLINLLAPEFYI